MTNLKVWGCKAYVLIPKPLQNKLTDKTWEYKFIRYVENGRKGTSLKPVMPSIDADDSGRKKQRRPSSMLKDYYLMESKVVSIENDPANFAKAMESHDAEQWLKAMHEELDSISKNEAWDLTELPASRNLLDASG